MADQLFFKSRYAQANTLDPNHVDLDATGLRVYRESPTHIRVQVRTRTAKKGLASSLAITKAQAIELAEYLVRKAEELADE